MLIHLVPHQHISVGEVGYYRSPSGATKLLLNYDVVSNEKMLIKIVGASSQVTVPRSTVTLARKLVLHMS